MHVWEMFLGIYVSNFVSSESVSYWYSIAKGFSLKASTPLFLSVFWWREQAQFKQGQLELPGANTLGYAFQPMISRVNRINNPASLPLSWEISKECFKLSQCIPVGLSCNFLNDATFIDIITFMPHFPALLLMLPDAISQIYYLSHIFISEETQIKPVLPGNSPWKQILRTGYLN